MSAEAQAPVLLVDTYSLFFRAHHALPPMNTSSGRPTSALYGFSTALLKELREQRPRALAFAVDAPFATFRHQEYAGYKAQRERAPDPLLQQFAPLRQLLGEIGGATVLYAGDDTTDEDAFAALASLDGVTVRVGEGVPTRAVFTLTSQDEVGELLRRLLELRANSAYA